MDEYAGFCGGVKKTIDLAENELKNSGEVYSLCELIHNPKEIERLEKKGLKIIDHIDLKTKSENKYKKARLITRAHGETKKNFQLAKQKGFTVIDGTCRIVGKLQRRIEKAYKEGYQIIIVGKKHHPEVISLMDKTDETAEVILDVNELNSVDYTKKTAIFAQTTISEELFDKVTGRLKNMFRNLEINKTICASVLKRKEQISRFLSKVDTLLFVGGKNSSNTKVLVDYCKSLKKETYHIESEKDVDIQQIRKSEIIGITGSASTPKWLMVKIKKYLENKLNTIN